MGAFSVGAWFAVHEKIFGGNAFGENLTIVVSLFVVVPASVALYFCLLKILRYPECDEFLRLALRRFRRSR